MDDSIDYQIAFRKKVFALLNMGYSRLEPKIFKEAQEEEITGEIVREMNEVLVGRSAPKWASFIAVHEDPRINSPRRKGKNRKKADIEFEYVRHHNRPRYPFEAKRLCTNSHPVGVYLGPEGLGEFISGNYAYDKNEAGMLGYIQSNTVETWASKIEKNFHDQAERIMVCPDGCWGDVRIISELSDCYRSKHNRSPEIGPITIYHALLIFH